MLRARSLWLPWVILVIALGLTWQIWSHERRSAQRQLKTHFDYSLQETISRVEQRMGAYEQMLRGVQAQYAAMGKIDRRGLQDYVAALQLDANFSGVQAIGQLDWVPAAQTEKHLAQMRHLGFSNYRIRPEGSREAYAPIVQREPDNERNRAALGFDAWADPVRRLAMERARDAGMPAISGKLRLSTDTEGVELPGFVMYLPIFARNQPVDTLELRRAHLVGWVTAAFQMHELMASLYGHMPPGISFSLHDGIEVSEQTLLYHSDPPTDKVSGLFAVNEYLVIGGRTWTLSMQAGSTFANRFGRNDATLIALSGVGLSLLLTLIAWLLTTSRSRALRLARGMTAELQEHEHFMRTVTDNIPGLVAYWNADLRCEFANAQHQEFFGKSSTEMQGIHLRDLQDGALYRQQEHHVVAVLRGEVQTFESSLTKADGSICHAYAYYLPDCQGDQVKGFYVLISDITPLKQVEAALLDSEQYARTAIDAMPEHICVLDSKGEIIAVNRAWRDFYRCNEQNAECEDFGVGFNYLAICHAACGPSAEEAEQMAQGVSSVMRGERPLFELEYPCNSPTEQRVFKARVTRFYGDSGNVLISHENITVRKRLENGLRHFESIVQSSEDAIISKSLNGIATSWNPGAELLYGFSADEMIGHSVQILFPADRQEEEAGILQRIRNGEAIEHFETVRLSKDGRRIDISATISPIFGAHGAIVGISTIARDISRQKLAEAELASYRNHLEALVEQRTAALTIAKEAAEAANRAKTVFLATMSHELRTPMNAIMGLTGIVLRNITDAKQIDYLEKVLAASNQLLGIINDILELSQMETRQIPLARIDFMLGDTLARLASTFKTEAQRKDLSFDVEIDPVLAARQLKGDAVRLEQVLFKLIGNAIKFTAAGSVTIRAAVAEESSADLLLRFEVSDTGIGISPEEQGRLFSAFEQLDGSMSRRYGGTGLGLAISQRLVQAMEGNIGVESQFGAGSTFWFTVRLGKEEALLSA